MRLTQHDPAPAQPADVQRQVLARAVRLLASASDFRDVLRSTIAACLPPLGDFGFFDVACGDQVIRTAAAHLAPDTETLLAGTQWVPQVRDDGLNLCALSTGEAALHPEIGDEWYRRVAADDGHLAVMRQLAFCSMITVPVRYRDELVGALTLFMSTSGRRHTPADLEFASELALLAAPVVANARLVEQHRQAEDALRRSEERLRLTTEAGQVGIWDWDIAADKVEWTDRVYELHGVPRDQPPGGLETFRSHVHPEDIGRVEESLRSALEGGPPYAVEYRITLPDGGTRWLATHSHVVRDADGRPVRMVGGCTDVTERMELLAAERRARGEAERAQRRLEIIARAGAALSHSLDPDETLQTIGEAIVPEIGDWCRIDLLDEHGVLQRRLAHHADPGTAKRAFDMTLALRAKATTAGSMASVIRTGEPAHGHFGEVRAADDPDLNLFTRTFGMGAYCIVPLIARGRTIGAMAVIQAESGRDLRAEDRSLVLELAQRAAMALDNARLYSAAEAANRTKDEFLAMLGHELRNPLAPIATALELMARRDDAAHVQERRIIGRQVAHLSRLIDDLLDVSRITRGKIQLLREPVDMRSVVANAIELTRPLFAQHVQPLGMDLCAEPVTVIGDPVRLAQVLSNLLTNAAKFTPPDRRVRLALRRVDEWVEIVVEDEGVGIDAALLPQVFELFVQGRQSIDRRSGGLGLGLAIVRTLVQLHGGTVSAHSEGPGRGSRFTVRLPASAGVAVPTRAPALSIPVAQGQRRILLVDDNVDAAVTMAELLGNFGFDVKCAHDADGAFETLRAFDAELALLDIGLPLVDGYELARRLRRDPAAQGLKLVALTGYGRENDREQALAAGFDGHLVKPVPVQSLLEMIGKLSPPASPSGTHPSRSA